MNTIGLKMKTKKKKLFKKRTLHENIFYIYQKPCIRFH